MNFFSLILKSLIINMNSRVARIVQRTSFRALPAPRGGYPTNDPPAEKNRKIKHFVRRCNCSGQLAKLICGGTIQWPQNGL